MEVESGKLITLEGPEGSGKTLQVRMLTDFLRSYGNQVIMTREPGGTVIGDQVRSVLTRLDNQSMHFKTEVLLFQAARAQLVEELIIPSLKQNMWVLVDRFFDSTLAYQGYGHGIDLGNLRGLINFATGGLTPDLTLLLDVEVETGLRRKRAQAEWNRLDAMQVDFHERVHRGYQEMAKAEPGRWRVVDANKPPGQVWEQIKDTVTDFFGLKSIGLLGIKAE